jgi:hypothetical protein
MHAQAEGRSATRKERGPARTGPRRIRNASPESGFYFAWYFTWQYQPCRPPNTQIKRMIGNGMPMSQSNSPRPMTSSSVACFWTVGLTVNGPEGSARRSCAHQLGTRGGSSERLAEGVGFEPHSARTARFFSLLALSLTKARSGINRGFDIPPLEGLAEGVGFEPTIRFPAYTLSKRAPSATRPPLRITEASAI